MLSEIEATVPTTLLVPARLPAAEPDASVAAAPTSTPRPALRTAAPLEAQAVSAFRAISVGAPGSAKTQQAGTPAGGGPWSVLVAAEAGALPFAEDLRAALRAKGMDVRTAAAPGSPDAVLALLPGAALAAWYCDWPRSGSAGLASSLAEALPLIQGSLPPDLDCESLHGAWPRVAVTAVTVSPRGDDRDTARAMADAVASHLSRYGASQRRARDAARLSWPAAGPITSGYGPSHPLGIDIGQWSGPVRAATDGIVYYAGGNPCCSYGRFVVLDGPDGIRTLYAHLDSLLVKAGDRVRTGQSIGEVGCSGACFGVHLHFEVFDGGIRRDPLAYLR